MHPAGDRITLKLFNIEPQHQPAQCSVKNVEITLKSTCSLAPDALSQFGFYNKNYYILLKGAKVCVATCITSLWLWANMFWLLNAFNFKMIRRRIKKIPSTFENYLHRNLLGVSLKCTWRTVLVNATNAQASSPVSPVALCCGESSFSREIRRVLLPISSFLHSLFHIFCS